MPELWNVMIHPSGRGSVGGRPRPAQRAQKLSIFNTFTAHGVVTIKTVKRDFSQSGSFKATKTDLLLRTVLILVIMGWTPCSASDW